MRPCGLASLVFALLGSTTLAGPPIVFRDVAAECGVDFRFDNGSRGRHDLPEIMGGGVALIDADGDGWLDLYFCNGGPIESRPGAADPPCRIYRNNGDGTFTGRDRDRPAPRGQATRWARRWATSTATAATTSSSPAGASSGSIATSAAAGSRT